MTFVFLPDDSETANNELARFHEEFLGAGDVGWVHRADDMRWLMSHFLKPQPWKQNGTTCALYQRGALMAAQLAAPIHVPPHRTPSESYAITTWVDFHFGGAQWIPIAKLKDGEGIIRGDLPYWSNTTSGADGHIGCVRDGSGFTWSTAEGGGGLPLGTCKLSDGRKDISLSHGRQLKGVVRPNHMTTVIRGRVDRERDTDPAPPPKTTPFPGTPLTLTRGSTGEAVKRVQRVVGANPDGKFGPQTESLVMAFQREHELVADGKVGPKTWAEISRVE